MTYTDLKGRPIIDGTNTPINHLSELLRKILSPTVKTIQSYTAATLKVCTQIFHMT